MKNKFLLSILFIGIISFFSINCLAYEDSRFSMDVPENYEKTSKNYSKNSYVQFSKDTGDNITISFVSTESPSTSNGRKNALKEVSDSFKDSIEKELGTAITIKNKDITTFSKNNYDCLVTKYYIDEFDIYQMQYTFFTDNYACSIAITGTNEAYLDEVQPIINSFTVTDTITDTSNDNFNVSLIFVSVTAVIIIGFIAGYFIISSKKKNKNNMTETTTSTDSIETIKENNDSNSVNDKIESDENKLNEKEKKEEE